MINFTAGKDDIAIELMIFKWWASGKGPLIEFFHTLFHDCSSHQLFHMNDLSMGHWHAVLQYRVDIGTRQK